MSYITKLVCSHCNREYELDEKVFMCSTEGCRGRINIYYDYEKIKEKITKDELSKRAPGVWKYFELLPLNDRKNIVTLGEGGTPFLKSKRLAENLGLKDLYMKDETRNPTQSFKDRPMTVGVSKAVEFGVKTLVIASSGNAAAAMAAYSARAGLTAYTFVPDFAPMGKIAQLLLLGARVVRVTGWAGGVDPTVKLMVESHKKYGWIPCPSFGPFNPWQFEGNKTLGYEIIEDLNFEVPDWLFVQVGAAGLLGGLYKGLREFKELGLIDTLPKIVAVQSEGNAPFIRAFKENMDPKNIVPWDHPETVAEGLEDPYPWDADIGLEAVKSTGGDAIAVPDSLILEAQRRIAKYEGLFVEPSGIAGLAGLMQMIDDGKIDSSDKVVILLTGGGLKDPEVVQKQFEIPPVINPKVEELEKVFPDLKK